MMMKRPPRLRRGDTIGIIAPSSPVDVDQLERSLAFLEQLGLRWRFGKHVCDARGYLAGADEDRLADLHDMFADPTIQGIICAGGGYGSARYADRIDYPLIQNNPKVFWGFSDITFLHNAMHDYANLVTFHGPMLASCVGKESFHPLSGKLFEQLFEPMELHYTEAISPLTALSTGVAEGTLVGGNLSILVNGLGTKFELDTKGKLLLLEEVGEKPYRVDAMLNQLRLAGKLEAAAGIVIGDFSEATPHLLDDVFDHYFSSFQKPVVKGFKIGHCEPHFAVPLGVMARLNAIEPSLTILPGVE